MSYENERYEGERGGGGERGEEHHKHHHRVSHHFIHSTHPFFEYLNAGRVLGVAGVLLLPA